jgi:hypothetical protein
MDDQAQLLYLEPDDEITSVVRRLRETDAPRVVLVASGRTKATTSAVALRLLAEVAAEEGREVVLVADASARALAGEAGIPAFASVGDANAEGAVPLEPTAPRRAPIHVVRGEPAPAAPPPASVPPPPAMTAAASGDETQAVPVPPPLPALAPSRPRPLAARRMPRAALAVVLVATLLLTAGGVAAVLPSARVTIDPATEALGPIRYELRFDSPQTAAGMAEQTVTHPVAGTYHDLAPATGSVAFFNWNTSTAVEVLAGTQVAANDIAFGTVATIVVPRAHVISFIPPTVQAGEAGVGIEAIEAGPAGNIAAEEIDTVVDENTAAQLRGVPDNPERLVTNPEPTAGGLDESGPLVEQADVDAAVTDLQTQLADLVANTLTPSDGAVIADTSPAPQPTINVPGDLLGTRDREEFELTGSLPYDRAWVSAEEVEAAARKLLVADTAIVPAGRELVAGSEVVAIEGTRREGAQLIATVSLTAATVATIDEDVVAGRIAGLTFEDARAELDDMGGVVEISGWPEWVDAVPRLTWRIEIDIAAPEASPSPQPS